MFHRLMLIFPFLLLQGSEIDTVVYVLGSPIYQDWQHVYTAVTRGVRQVIVVHDPNHLKQVVMKNRPHQRWTRLTKFLTDGLAKSPVSDEAESDPEADILTPSASDLTLCPGHDEEDDVFHSPSLDTQCSSFGHPATSESLEVAPSCNASTGINNPSNYKTWEDEFKDECDDEVLAWALESSQQVNQEVNTSYPDPQRLSLTGYADNYKPSGNATKGSSKYPLERTCPHNNAITGGDFQIARSNLNIKKESRYTVECGMEESSYSSVVLDGDQSEVLSDNFLASRNGVRLKNEKQDETERDMLECSNGQFSGSLSALAFCGIDTFSSTVHQGSLVPNSPKTCSRRFSESSGFPTPPQTPPNAIKSSALSSNPQSNTFPRKSVSQRTQLRKSGGTPAKSRRRSFTARYNTWCGLCKNSISAGVDEITHLNNGSTSSWVHQKCIQFK